MADDGRCSPDATASRELEEETHGLIPAADSRAVLNNCPVFYCHNSKMAIYLMRYAGGQQLPGLLEKRLAGGCAEFGGLYCAGCAVLHCNAVLHDAVLR
jgi:hypothetical protein